MNKSCIFDGQYTQPGLESVIFEPNENGVLFYMENESNKEVLSGSYYTYYSEGSSAIQSGAIYGTNTDPTSFDATDESNWDYVCDLTIISENPDPDMPPSEANKRIVATGGNFYGDFDYLYSHTSPSENYVYSLVVINTDTLTISGHDYDVEYNPVDKTFQDVGTNAPFNYSSDDLIIKPCSQR